MSDDEIKAKRETIKFWRVLCQAQYDRLVAAQAMIKVLLDSVDYTAGNCKVNEMIGAILDKAVIEKAREVIQ